MRGSVVALLVIVLTVIVPARAHADGMAFRTLDATGEVQATAQRAVMWLRHGQGDGPKLSSFLE